MKIKRIRKIFSLAATVFLIAPLAVAENQIETGQSLVRSALQAHGEDNNTAALEHLREAEILRPNHPLTLSLLAQIAALDGKSDEAFAALERLASLQVTTQDIRANENYNSLKSDPRFEALARQFDKNALPKGTATLFAMADEKIALVESLAFDPASGDLFLGAMVDRKIVKRSLGETWTTFASAKTHGLYSVSALHIDAENNLLWVASPATNVTPGLEQGEEGRSAIFGLDLVTGEIRHQVTLADDGNHWFGDFLVMPNGNLIVSDSASPNLYLFDVEANELLPYISHPGFVSLQGLALAKDGMTLIIADYANGLFAVNLMDETVTDLSPGHGVVPYGIDGLYRHGAALIAVQNGTSPQRVSRIHFNLESGALTSQEILVQGHSAHLEPTLGQIVGDRFLYVANSGWPLFGKEEEPAQTDIPFTKVLELELGPAP